MKKLHSYLFVISIVISLLLTACGGGGDTPVPAGSAGEALDRPAPPEEFVKKKSPGMSSSDVEKGKRLYDVNCASCHGDKGLGDGPSSAMLSPKPLPIANEAANLSDAYMFWRISEGGLMQPFKSAMPAWNSILTEEEIWQVIAYIRKLGTN